MPEPTITDIIDRLSSLESAVDSFSRGIDRRCSDEEQKTNLKISEALKGIQGELSGMREVQKLHIADQRSRAEQFHTDILRIHKRIDELKEVLPDDDEFDELKTSADARFNKIETSTDTRFNKIETRVNAIEQGVSKLTIKITTAVTVVVFILDMVIKIYGPQIAAFLGH